MCKVTLKSNTRVFFSILSENPPSLVCKKIYEIAQEIAFINIFDIF